MPATLKVAVVAGLAAFANVAVPGPLVRVHRLVTAAPVGKPSSVTVPASVAPAGNVIVWFAPVVTIGATLVGSAGFTVTVVSANAVSAVSLAVKRKTYVPATLNVAIVAGLAAFTKVTVPGPLVRVHRLVTAAPVGKPSSVTVPASGAPAGNVIVWLVPVVTIGATFVGSAGFTVMVVSANALSAVSLAVKRNTYVPATLNVAVVAGLAAFANVTVPGPLVRVHRLVTAAPVGNPSSVTVPASVAPAGNVIV